MLKKLAARFNPFAAKPAAPVPDTTVKPHAAATLKPAHPHSFSCPCVMCELETHKQTLARLKRQAP